MTEQTRRASRLIQIERLLRRNPAGLTTTQLANELGYSPRTIQRDIGVLESELGVPLIVDGRRYKILPGSHPLAPLRLTIQEARVLLLAIRLLFKNTDSFDPDAISALEKIAGSLSHTIAFQAEVTVNLLRRRPQHRAQQEVLARLTEAWAASRTVTIEYRSHDDPAYRTTALDPYLFEPGGRSGVYVIGYSARHHAVRTFKVDRIRRATLTDHTFDQDDQVIRGLLEQLAFSWGVVFGEERHHAVVDFTPAVAGAVNETIWHPSQALLPLPGGGVRMEVWLPNFIEFVPWVRSWGPEAIVVEPAELREEVAGSLRKAAARYVLP
ncbi:MAG: WYL domain-containing protein [Dehalococcoidia bacterium]